MMKRQQSFQSPQPKKVCESHAKLSHSEKTAVDDVCETGYAVLDLRSAIANPGTVRTYLAEAPELKDIECPFRGQAKLSLASSFHHPLIRLLRREAHALMEVILRETHERLKGTKCKRFISVADALVIRRKRSSVQPDQKWHRDRVQDATEDMLYFGGFINLGDSTQLFQCVPASHRDTQGSVLQTKSNGFIKENKQEDRHVKTVEIPPGHIIVFCEWMLHTIQNHPCLRLFIGFGTSDAEDTLPQWKEMLQKRIQDQAPLWIKGGQILPLINGDKNQFMNSSTNKEAVASWAQTYLVERVVVNVEPWMSQRTKQLPQAPSLRDLHCMYPAYDNVDLAILGLTP